MIVKKVRVKSVSVRSFLHRKTVTVPEYCIRSDVLVLKSRSTVT